MEKQKSYLSCEIWKILKLLWIRYLFILDVVHAVINTKHTGIFIIIALPACKFHWFINEAPKGRAWIIANIVFALNFHTNVLQGNSYTFKGENFVKIVFASSTLKGKHCSPWKIIIINKYNATILLRNLGVNKCLIPKYFVQISPCLYITHRRIKICRIPAVKII